jgi:glycosyltransferase involved in cell wall biosynthesis
MKLSICMPVHNEEKHLGDCLENLRFADEIVVGLDKCTDRSKEIALAYNAKIIEGSWPLEGERRNAVFDACTGDWILEIDADERVTSELEEEIRHIINASDADIFAIPFHNYIGTRLVKYGWGAYVGVSKKIILFRKGTKHYQENGKVTHAPVTFNGKFGPRLKNPVIHHMDADLSDTIRRFNSYTNASAKDLLRAQENGGTIGTFGKNFIRLFSRFYKSYIRRKGYREGSLGFLIGMLAALYPMVSYIKAKYRL